MSNDTPLPAPRSALTSALPRAVSSTRPHPGAGRPPEATAGGSPAGAAPRVADLAALLGQINTLRATLQTDLTLAAAALDAGAPEVAAELVGDDVHAVADFQARSLAHLRALETVERAAASPWALPDSTVGQHGPVPPPGSATGADDAPHAEPGSRQGGTVRVLRRLLPGAPLVAAAAALLALFGGVSSTPTPPPTVSAVSAAAAASYELESLASRGASSEELVAAAANLNDELARMVADSGNSPETAQTALLLLQRSTVVLARSTRGRALDGVLADARLLEAVLRRALPPDVERSLAPVVDVLPSLRPNRPAPSARPSEATTRPTPEPQTAPSPAASPRPSVEPSPAAPSTNPSPDPESSSSFAPLIPGALPG